MLTPLQSCPYLNTHFKWKAPTFRECHVIIRSFRLERVSGSHLVQLACLGRKNFNTFKFNKVYCEYFQVSFAHVHRWIPRSISNKEYPVTAGRIIALLACLPFLTLASNVAIHFWRQLQRLVRNTHLNYPCTTEIRCHFEYILHLLHWVLQIIFCFIASNGNITYHSYRSLSINFYVWNESKKTEFSFSNIFCDLFELNSHLNLSWLHLDFLWFTSVNQHASLFYQNDEAKLDTFQLSAFRYLLFRKCLVTYPNY